MSKLRPGERNVAGLAHIYDLDILHLHTARVALAAPGELADLSDEDLRRLRHHALRVQAADREPAIDPRVIAEMERRGMASAGVRLGATAVNAVVDLLEAGLRTALTQVQAARNADDDQRRYDAFQRIHAEVERLPRDANEVLLALIEHAPEPIDVDAATWSA